MLGWIMLGSSLLGGLVGGFQANAQIDERNAQIDRQLEANERQRTYLTNQYQKQDKYANYQFGQSMQSTNDQLANTLQNRNTQAIVNANNLYNSNKNTLNQLNNTIVQYTASKGSLDSQLANTGFRNTGTLAKQKELSEEMINSEIEFQTENSMNSIAMNYLNARMNYLDATKNAEIYKNNLANILNQYMYNKQQLSDQYNYQKTELDKQDESLRANKIENDWRWAYITMGAINGAIGLGNSSYQLANSYANAFGSKK